MTLKQLNFVNRLLEREALTFASEELALEYSNNRTANLEDLTHAETQKLITCFIKPNPIQKMKRKILSMAHEMRWETEADKVDMLRLDAWCIKYTPSHCAFNDIPKKDLPTVVSIYEKMYKNFLKQL